MLNAMPSIYAKKESKVVILMDYITENISWYRDPTPSGGVLSIHVCTPQIHNPFGLSNLNGAQVKQGHFSSNRCLKTMTVFMKSIHILQPLWNWYPNSVLRASKLSLSISFPDAHTILPLQTTPPPSHRLSFIHAYSPGVKADNTDQAKVL